MLGTGGVTNISATGGINVVTVGNNHIADGVTGTVNVTGTGSDTLTIDDSGNTNAKMVNITNAAVTGVSPAAINYTGLSSLTVLLGSGHDNATIASTNASTTTLLNTGGGNDSVRINSTSGPTTVNTGTGTNTVSIGTSPTSTVNGIQGALVIMGSGRDSLNLDDSGSSTSKSGTLTSTTITGLGMGPSGVTFSGISLLSITLGSLGNTFTVSSTPVAVVILSTGSGNDLVNVLTTSAGSQTIVNTGGGTNTVNVGNALSSLGGQVSVAGGGTTDLERQRHRRRHRQDRSAHAQRDHRPGHRRHQLLGYCDAERHPRQRWQCLHHRLDQRHDDHEREQRVGE